jgi:hypothetical protein
MALYFATQSAFATNVNKIVGMSILSQNNLD